MCPRFGRVECQSHHQWFIHTFYESFLCWKWTMVFLDFRKKPFSSHQLIFHKRVYEPLDLLIDHACGDVEQNHRRSGGKP